MSYDPVAIFPYKSGLSLYYKPFLIGNDAFTELDNCYTRQGVVKKREGSTILGNVGKYTGFSSITNTTPPVVTSVNHGLATNDMVYFTFAFTTNGKIIAISINPGTLQPTITTNGNHGMSAGQTVWIDGVVGLTQLNGQPFNDVVFEIISLPAPNQMLLNVEVTGAYVSGGFVYLGAITNTAFAITVLTNNTFSLQNLNSSPPANMTASGTAVSGNIFLPIVGTRQYIQSTVGGTSLGIEQLIVFTPKNAYQFDAVTQVFDNISFNQSGAPILWGGTKDNFFYSSNYFGVFWATNNIFATPDQPVGIRFYNGTLLAGWQDFQPQLLSNGTVFLNSALLIFPYKGFLVTLNTTEGAINNAGDINYFNRARWSQLGTPFYQAGQPIQASFDPNAWVTDIVGKGGFTDADTNEKIVSVEIIQDTAIVGFQFSTWRLRFTGNYIQPFIWERINTQFGSEATFSTISFDDKMLEISRRGIVGATFNDVDRIDLQIPDFVEQFEDAMNIQGLNRIQGIRDYEKRLVYWIYADQAGNFQTPNKILCYNYIDQTWSTFTQSFTTLGRYNLTLAEDNTWQTWTSPWKGDTTTWQTGTEQTGALIIVAGDVASNVWQIMNEDFSTDNGVPYNIDITSNWINPYFKSGKRCKLAYYDLYITTTGYGQITLENYSDDDDSDPWLIKTVDTNDNALTTNPVKIVKYIRVFLGMVARNHKIRLTLTDDQLNDDLIGTSDFELQGIIFHTREEGRIKS